MRAREFNERRKAIERPANRGRRFDPAVARVARRCDSVNGVFGFKKIRQHPVWRVAEPTPGVWPWGRTDSAGARRRVGAAHGALTARAYGHTRYAKRLRAHEAACRRVLATRRARLRNVPTPVAMSTPAFHLFVAIVVVGVIVEVVIAAGFALKVVYVAVALSGTGTPVALVPKLDVPGR